MFLIVILAMFLSLKYLIVVYLCHAYYCDKKLISFNVIIIYCLKGLIEVVEIVLSVT